jgi:hypothetical protein
MKRIPPRLLYTATAAALAIGTVALVAPAVRGGVAAASADLRVDCSAVGRWDSALSYGKGDLVWLWDGSHGSAYRCIATLCRGVGTIDRPRTADDPYSSRSWQPVGVCRAGPAP